MVFSGVCTALNAHRGTLEANEACVEWNPSKPDLGNCPSEVLPQRQLYEGYGPDVYMHLPKEW